MSPHHLTVREEASCRSKCFGLITKVNDTPVGKLAITRTAETGRAEDSPGQPDSICILLQVRNCSSKAALSAFV